MIAEGDLFSVHAVLLVSIGGLLISRAQCFALFNGTGRVIDVLRGSLFLVAIVLLC